MHWWHFGHLSVTVSMRLVVFSFPHSFLWELCQGTSSSCAVDCRIRYQIASEPLSPFPVSSPDSQYWIYDGERRVSGPTPIVELGLPASPVQAALVWGAEKNKIYIFSGGNYWRFHPHTRQVDNIYPRTMADWRGVPQEIDAAFQDELGQCSRDVASSGAGAQADDTSQLEEWGRFRHLVAADAPQP